MASYIKIKRSTGTIAPATLQYGELAYTTGVGTHGNSGGRLFIGDNVPNAIPIGGRYYTDLLSIAPGLVAGQNNPTTPANGFVAILDQNRKVDQWNVDNLTLDGNTLSSTNTDGDINIDPNGTGQIVIPDDTFLTFGTSKDTRIRYDEAVDDRLEVEGADWNFANGVSVTISDTTQSISTTTGALVVSGGVGVSGNLNVGGILTVDNIVGTISTATKAITVDTTTAVSNIYYPGLFVSPTGTSSTSIYVDSGISYNSDTDALTLSGDLNVNGGDIFTSSTTATLFNTSATTVNAFGQATNVGIGSTSGSLNLRSSTIVGSNSTQNLFNTVATNLNIGGSATSLVMGASSGIATINNSTLSLPNASTVNVNGANPVIASSSTGTLTLFNTNLTRVNAFQAATDLVLSATTGVTTVRNKLTVGGNLEVDGNNIQASDGNTNITLTSNTLTTFAGDIRVNGNDIQASDGNTNITLTSNTLTTFSGDIRVNGNDIQSSSGNSVITLNGSNATFANDLTVNGNTTLGNAATDQVNITGNVYQVGVSTNVGGAFFDAVGISSNTIFTRAGSGDKLFIDPFPDGLSNEGTVIIKGDLQVDGTTTTVNSVTVTSNNPIYVVGDNATTRTVTSTVASGNQLTIDSVAGINTSDVVSGTNIPSNTIISSINSGTKVITLSNNITGTINSGSQITISQGVDTNDDRGIAFKYVSSGIGTEAVVKTGFFGYVDSTSRWTYIPDAGIAGNVVTGTKGFLDIKGIYYQSGDFSTNGITYFDNNGLMKSTVSPGSGISTSNYILTTDAAGVPTWTDTIDGGMF